MRAGGQRINGGVMQRIDILPAGYGVGIEYSDGLGEVHHRPIDARAAEMLRRWARMVRLLDRIIAETLDHLDVDLRRGGETKPKPLTGPVTREHPLDLMWKKRQISDRGYMAGRAIDTMLSQVRALEGLGSTLRGEGIQGSGARDAAALARMQVTQRWSRVVAEIMTDSRCGGVPEHRRLTVRVLEMVCHEAQSIADIERAGGFGRRAVLARRLKGGLDAAARALSIRDAPEGRIGVVHYETTDGAESEESEAV